MRKLRLRGRLLVSFLLVIIISLGSVWLYAWITPYSQLDDVPRFFSQRYAQTFTPLFTELYIEHGSWEAAEPYLQRLTEPRPPLTDELPTLGPTNSINLNETFIINRALLADASFQVLADTDSQNVGEILSSNLQKIAVPLQDKGQLLGYLVIVSGFDGRFVDALIIGFRRTITVVGLWSAVMSLLVSIVLAYQLAQPLRQLSTAAQAIAAGQPPPQLPVKTHDEIGELTSTFNDMAAAIEQQKRLRQQMVADIAHELRTPLSVMQLEIEGLEDGLQSAEEAVPTLKTKIKTLGRLITDLRLLSLADAQELYLELAPLDPNEFLEQTVSSWQSQAAVQQIELELNLESKLPLIQADEGRLYQVLQNLISNALRHTPTHGRVQIGGREDGTTVTLWVQDSGSGIPAEEFPHIFERFYRADKSRNRETGGSGLGLAIAKRLITLHHGRIWAESTIGKGTTFWLTLPKDTKN